MDEEKMLELVNHIKRIEIICGKDYFRKHFLEMVGFYKGLEWALLYAQKGIT